MVTFYFSCHLRAGQNSLRINFCAPLNSKYYAGLQKCNIHRKYISCYKFSPGFGKMKTLPTQDDFNHFSTFLFHLTDCVTALLLAMFVPGNIEMRRTYRYSDLADAEKNRGPYMRGSGNPQNPCATPQICTISLNICHRIECSWCTINHRTMLHKKFLIPS
jgi:hypothetical protein